ncbi:MAG: sodium ion-translocating decarboxylase subunit beta, partial [Epsilonproteobacteria bacterium]|nr:sodium ion-translocating decarboxylase subunit beta [Campylobacterota bacterium]
MKNLIFVLLTFFAISFVANPLYASSNENVVQTQKVVKTNQHIVKSISGMFKNFYRTTGIYAFLNPKEGAKNALGEPLSKFAQSWGRVIMIFITFLLFYLAIAKGFEPLLLLPIAFGGLLANIPLADIIGHGGFIGTLFDAGIKNEMFPLIIFMGVGAMTDFGPLIANPKTALLGAAAQFGIFGSLVGAVALSQYTPLFDFTLKQASAISIIGGADGPTSIFVASRLSPDLMGAIAVAAYSYMALVPIIQPPIMRLFTTEKERKIKMVQ